MHKIWVALEIVLLVFVPTVVMQDIRVLAYRPLLMALTVIYIASVVWHTRHSPADLGLTRLNLRRALGALLPPSLLFTLLMTTLVFVLPRTTVVSLIGSDGISLGLGARLLAYVTASVPAQELMYRGYLMLRLRVLSLSTWVSASIAILVFTLGHLPFKSPLMLIVAFVLGILYTRNYLKYQNLLAICASHAMVGATLIIVRDYFVPFS